MMGREFAFFSGKESIFQMFFANTVVEDLSQVLCFASSDGLRLFTVRVPFIISVELVSLIGGVRCLDAYYVVRGNMPSLPFLVHAARQQRVTFFIHNWTPSCSI